MTLPLLLSLCPTEMILAAFSPWVLPKSLRSLSFLVPTNPASSTSSHRSLCSPYLKKKISNCCRGAKNQEQGFHLRHQEHHTESIGCFPSLTCTRANTALQFTFIIARMPCLFQIRTPRTCVPKLCSSL